MVAWPLFQAGELREQLPHVIPGPCDEPDGKEDPMSQLRERTMPTTTLAPRVRGIERGWAELPRYQTRTCVHCGRHTTFVLEDAIGDWYRCLHCGAYA